MNKILPSITIATLLLISCENWLCDEDDTNIIDNGDTEEALRFEPLDEPIEGKLLFVSGPSLSDIDTTEDYYNTQWDFWTLTGNSFTKINEIPFMRSGSRWHFSWSPKGNYFSFFNDMGGDVPNTDEIGILDPTTTNEFYLTSVVGDANPGDQCIYNWSQNEEYIYFTALEYGISEYEETANSDIYRVKFDGSELENLTNSDYFEMVVTPNPDGTKLAYFIDRWNSTPDSVQGLYVMDLNTLESEMIINIPYEYYVQGELLAWDNSSEHIVIGSPRLGDHGITYLNLSTNNYQQVLYNLKYLNYVVFIPNSSKALINGKFWNEDKRTSFVYDFESNEILDLPSDININFSWHDIPVPSPNGEYIAFTSSGIDMYEVENWNQFYFDTEIYLLDLETFEKIQLTHGNNTWEGFLKWVE